MRGACNEAQNVPHWCELLVGNLVADHHGRMFDLSRLRLEDSYREGRRVSYHFREGDYEEHLYDIVRIFLPERGVKIHIWVREASRAVDSVTRMAEVDATGLKETSYMMRALASLGAANVHELSNA